MKQNRRFTLLARLTLGVFLTYGSAFAEGEKKSTGSLDSLKYVEGNEKENEKRALRTELLVAASEEKALEQIQLLLKKHKGTYLEADLYFRMAELYMRRSKTERFFELHRQSETVVQLAPRVVKNASSKREITKAVEIYDQIQRKYRNFDKMDLVIFNYAFARQTLGQNTLATRLYYDLIKMYPGSSLVPDAHLAIGEVKFDEQKFQEALVHFLAIEKYSDSRVYPYGMYKAAWTYYNLRKEDLGLKKLEQVVAFGKMVEGQGIDSRLDLRREALADMTLFIQDVHSSTKAYAYFSEQAGNLPVAPVILKLANIYERHARYNDKQTVLTALIDNQPYSPLIPKVYQQLVWNYENQNNKTAAVKQLEALNGLCEPSSRWSKKQLEKKKKPSDKVDTTTTVSDKCLKKLHSTSIKLASKWLRVWKKNPGHVDFADASEKGFEIYLLKDRVSKKVGEARFTYAELLFQRDKFRPASAQYAIVSGQTEDPKLRHDSGYAALLSLEKAVGEKWSEKDETLFKTLAHAYVAQNPKGQFRLDIQFKIALIAYEKERYDEAGPLFLELGRIFAKEEKGLKAQDLYLDILNIKKDYAGLTTYSRELLKVGGDATRVDRLSKVYQQAWFLQIQKIEEDGQFPDAIAQYQKFIEENASYLLTEKAVWNKTQLLYKTLRYNEAAASSVDFYNRYPKSPQAQDSLLRAAQTYESLGQLAQASAVLQRLMTVDITYKEKWMTLAADFAKLSGQKDKAKSFYTTLRESADPKLSGGALDQLLQMAEADNNPNEAAKWRAEILRRNVQPQASLVAMARVEQLYKSGQSPAAFSEAKGVLNMGPQASKLAKSKARYIQGRILEDEFKQQSVKTRAERVAIVLALKTEKLEKAQEAYQSAMRYGDPVVAVECLTRLAGLYQQFVEDLKTMPLPEGLGEADESVFREETSQLSIPLEEKSVETMAKALEAAKDLQLRDGKIADLRQQLDRLNMKSSQRFKMDSVLPQVALPVVKGLGS